MSLKTILCETGSQCSSFKIGVIWHELLRFVCAEDKIFDSAGDRKGEHSHYRAVK